MTIDEQQELLQDMFDWSRNFPDYVSNHDDRLYDLEKFEKHTGPVTDEKIAQIMYRAVCNIKCSDMQDDVREAKELV